MGKKRSRDTAFGPDDYNQPTEPVEAVNWPPYAAPTYTMDGSYPDAQSVPTPYAGTRPFPQAVSPEYPVYLAPSSPAYPVLPPPPIKKYRGHPPGGSPPVYQTQRRMKRNHPFLPGLLKLFFILVRLALLARLVCMVLSISATNTWLSLLFQASNLFIWPMGWLAANINISVLAGTQLLIYLEFLLALLLYGWASRILVAFVRALVSVW